MFLNNPADTRVVLRSVIFTQSLYLAACLCIALFFRFFFRAEWMRYVLWGGWFLAIYGIYEWLFFLIFQQPGDFIANRTYGEEMHTGSWSQTIQMGPFSLLRIKSTFGEPSFFSAAVIPYLFLAVQYKRKWLSAALLFCIVFSTSTSAYIGFPFALILYMSLSKKIKPIDRFVILLYSLERLRPSILFIQRPLTECSPPSWGRERFRRNPSGSEQAMNETVKPLP